MAEAGTARLCRDMPRRKDIESILVLGSGPIVIGQACEFDYSGVQAVKALKEEGYRVVLVNSNPATIMTDPELADATYIEPLVPRAVARIIEKERPDALLPTVGGQTGINLTVEQVDKEREILEMAVEMGGEDVSEWAGWFPAYGSEAYVASGQEQALAFAEKNEIPYFPV